MSSIVSLPARLRPWLTAVALGLLLSLGSAAEAMSGQAAHLLARYRAIQPRLLHNPFGVPIDVQSREQGDLLVAEVYGRVNDSLARVRAALASPAGWCGLLALTLNVKACVHDERGDQRSLTLYVGRKFYQPPADARRMRYRFESAGAGPGYFAASLAAASGPLGTSDYRIVLEAAAVPGGTLIHIRSSYRSSIASRWATSAYLATLGRGKVGFSRTGLDGHGRPVYVEGVRGIVERNTMRYYLALQAVLDTQTLAPAARFEAGIRRWFELTERYRRQLHEIDRTEYLQAKRREHRNQLRLQAEQTVVASGR